VGTWSLLGWHEQGADGAVLRHPFGEHPLGRLIYTPDGKMTGILAAADAEDFLSYSGAFRLEDDRVVHSVDISSERRFLGSDLVRLVDLDGDDLTLRTLTDRNGTHNVLRWRRARR
jgi:hypothetical protein